MTEFKFAPPPRRVVKEIPLAPVLDLLTVVIFFLLLSTSFVELTKQTLPPSSTSVISDAGAPVPLNLRLFLVRSGSAYKFALEWAGEKPGREERPLPASVAAGTREKDLREVSANLAQELKQRYPLETSVQVGLGSSINYQEVIAVMDGVREHFDDLVMVSPQDAESKGR